jgi:hypothetical protein
MRTFPGPEVTMSRMHRGFPILCLLTISLITASLANAQGIGGAISGQVVDQSGGAVVGATVRIVNRDTNQSRSVGTGEDGRYEARELPPGRYRVTIENPGFKIVEIGNLNIGVGQNARLQTITVEPVPVEVTETVRADAQVALVESTTPTLSTSFGDRQIRELPILNRDLNNLALLAPGVFSVRAFSFASTLVPFAANGSRGRDNNFIIDSVDNNEPLFGGAATQFTNSDLFAEYRILTNQFKAEYGRNSGSVVNIVTERGGNRWRGSLFWFGQHDNFNATNSVERAAQLNNTTLFYENQIGATLGGPIKSESSWVFMSYQWDRARHDLSPVYPLVSTMPTAAGITELSTNSAFSGLPTVQHLLGIPSVASVPQMSAPCGNSNSGLPAMNPCTISNIFPGFTVPGVPVTDPGPDGMLFTADDFLVPVEFGTFLVPRAGIYDVRDHQGSVRWDQRLSNRDDIYIRYLFDDVAFPVSAGGVPREVALSDLGLFPDFRTVLQQRTQNLGMFWTRAWPRALHELRGSYTRISSTTGALETDRTLREDLPAVTVQDRLALDTNLAGGGTPQGTASLLAAFSAAGDTFTIGRDSRPRLVNTNIFQVQDNVSISRGKHSIKFGANFVRTQSNIRETPSDSGQYFYTSLDEYVHNFPFFAFQRFPNYLGKGGDVLPLREFAHFYFFQDDYQMSPNLVVSFGMRYENYGQVINSIADKNPQFGTKINTDMNNWAPRFGFAWSPRRSLVFRGGYGVFYNPTPFVIPLLIYQSGPISPLVGFPFFLLNDTFPNRPFDVSTLQLDFPGIDCAATFALVPASVSLNPVRCTPQDTVTANLRQPYVQNFSLSMQQQMGRDWLFEVSYVGSKGTKLFQRLDRNPQRGWDILDTAPLADGVDPFGCLQFAGKQDECRLPRAQANRGAITEVINGANSVYHAGQVSLTKRLNRPSGLAATVAYTWSHMIDNASEIFGPNLRIIRGINLNSVTPIETITPFPQDPNNATSAERASSAFDRRHRLALSFLWALPSPGSTAGRFFFGNWQFNGFFTYQSGAPFSALNGTGRCIDALGDGILTNDRPDVGSPSAPKNAVALLNNRLCLDPRDAGDPTIAGLIAASVINAMAGDYITPDGMPISASDARFVQVGLNRTGNAGRNTLVGPNLINMDFAIFKNFPWGETKNLQFRLEFYNLFNRANPGNPIGNVFTTNAQPVPAIAFDATAATPARVTGTFPENSIDALDSATNQSLFLSRQFMNTSARRLQFAVKYIF